MEVQLQSLIDQINSDGIEQAKKQSAQILDETKQLAATIVKEAENNACEIIESAKNEVGTLEENSKKALKLAARDSVLSVKQQIQDLFERIISIEVTQVLAADFVGEMIVKLLEKWEWSQADNEGLEFLLSKGDLDKLEGYLLGQLKDRLIKGVTLKLSKNVESGFRVQRRDDDFHFDFTEIGIADLFAGYLNPKLDSIIRDPD